MDDRRIDRDSDLGDDSPMSNSHADDHSDREEDDMIREECESSDEGVNLNVHTNENEALDFARSPKRPPSDTTNIHHPFVPSHALSMLGNFMNVSNIPNLHQHNDVLEKLKAQVGLIDPEFTMQTLRNMTTPPNSGFNVPQSGDTTGQPHNLSQQKGFSFTTPNPPNTKEGNPESNSSTTSDASNSSQQNNGWSYEEQFKQVRQLYEISDDPKRKELLDDLFSFMQKRGTPINRLPIMAKSVLDLYELYNLVIARGGLVDVINKKLWQEIIKGLHLPSSITSAAFTLRTQYMKYLYPYECEKKGLSTQSELQAAIDGNRREGRRSSYGQFDSQMQGQLQQLVSESHGENNQVDLNMLSRLLQQQQVQRSPISGGLQQISPLSLVHGGTQNSHHNLLGNSQIGPMDNLMTQELNQRMFQYLKMIQQTKEAQRSQSPDCIRTDTVKLNQIDQMNANALEMSRVALWSMYSNNTSPPISNNTISPPSVEPQREALNLTDSPTRPIKREREHVNEYDYALQTSKKLTQQSHNHYNHEHRRRSLSSPSSDRRRHSVERETNHHDHRNGLLDFHDNPHKSDSPTSHHRNGTNNGSHNGSSDLLNACSPIAMLSGMQFKLFSRGSENGEQQLVVSMEFNGVQYEGVLFANRVNTTQSVSPTTSSPPCTPNKVPVTPSGSNASPMVEDRNRVVNTVSRPLVSS